MFNGRCDRSRDRPSWVRSKIIETRGSTRNLERIPAERWASKRRWWAYGCKDHVAAWCRSRLNAVQQDEINEDLQHVGVYTRGPVPDIHEGVSTGVEQHCRVRVYAVGSLEHALETINGLLNST